MSSDASVLVIGSTGFIGSHLTERLVQRGERVRVLARKSSDKARLEKLGVEIADGSLEDLESVKRATHGVRRIYNCAGKSADWGPWKDFYDANVRGVENLLAAAERVDGLDRLTHLSTTDVYGYPVVPFDETHEPRDIGLIYNKSKVGGERAIQNAIARSRLPVTIIRPVNVYGPRSRDFVVELANLMLKKEMVFIDKGGVAAGLSYVENLVEGIIGASLSPNAVGKAYNLRDRTNETWKQYMDRLATGVGAPPISTSIPSAIAFNVARAAEFLYEKLGKTERPMLTRHLVFLFSRDQAYPTTAADRDFGFAPSITFDQGVERTLSWLGTPEGKAVVRS